jgi:hypothetical protein
MGAQVCSRRRSRHQSLCSPGGGTNAHWDACPTAPFKAVAVGGGDAGGERRLRLLQRTCHASGQFPGRCCHEGAPVPGHPCMLAVAPLTLDSWRICGGR